MINGLQHIGYGVKDLEKSYNFYKKLFGYNITLNDLTIEDYDMAPIVGSVEVIHSLMAVNLNGGSSIELIQHKSSPIKPMPDNIYNNLGILETAYKVNSIEKVIEKFKNQGINIITPILETKLTNGKVWKSVYMKDPDNLTIQLIEEISNNKKTSQDKPCVYGSFMVGISVSDLENSIKFYSEVLGFENIIYRYHGTDQELELLTGREINSKVAILERRAPVKNHLSSILPKGTVKLIEVEGESKKHIYKGRRWGDIGCMELSMDVVDLNETIEYFNSKNVKLYYNKKEIDMGWGSKGYVAYIRDPDGTIIEFVEIKTIAWVPLFVFMFIALPLLKLYSKISK